jgi:hypothetical protein
MCTYECLTGNEASLHGGGGGDEDAQLHVAMPNGDGARPLSLEDAKKETSTETAMRAPRAHRPRYIRR